MPAQLELVSTGPHESCRTDYLTVTFKFSSEDQEQDLFAYFHDLAEKVLPSGGFLPTRPGKNYASVYGHQSGVTIESSPLDSARTTRGTAAVSLSGSVWGALDAWERACLLRDITQWPGYYHCTRWDAQITVLNPPLTVEQIVRDVEEGRLWAAGFSQQNPWGQRKSDGSFVSPPTQYFGSPQSNIRLRVYDHGAAHGWSLPSLRVEAQIRKRYANDHTLRLARRCLEERETPPLLVTAEERTVKDALAQHADFRDTSRWAGREKPTKWRQTAPKSPWWDEILQHRGSPTQLSHKPAVTLERAAAACRLQYGRKLSKYWLVTIGKFGFSWNMGLLMFMLECAEHLKPEDLLELLSYCETEEQKERMRKEFHYLTEKSDEWLEHAGFS